MGRPAVSSSLTVCLILEGSYPFITGGVSAWVQELISALPEIRFVLYTLSPKRDQPVRYTLPPNVAGHRDIVLHERRASSARPRGRDALVEEIRGMHSSFAAGKAPDIAGLLRRMPAGYSLSRDAMRHSRAWSMVVEGSQAHNPIYPFADYFWSWKSAHDILFTVLADPAPEADLYHAVSTGYAGLAGTVARLRTGKPFLLTEHGLYHKEREMEIKRAGFVKGYQRDMWISIYNDLSRLCYRAADRIISLFEYNRRRQIELGADEDKAIVIPNGIDIPRFSAVVRQKKPGFHVGLVGRVVPIKDIKTFILMAKIVADALPEARFWCIGPTDEDPAYFEDCKALVESFQIADRFTFTGKADVRAYYGFLDVLLLTSVREAQPLVILEAFAAGLPVASTRVGNVPELLGYDERFLASSKDAEALARSVRWVHDHPAETAELVIRNKDTVARFYDKAAVYRRYGALYRGLVEGGS